MADLSLSPPATPHPIDVTLSSSGETSDTPAVSDGVLRNVSPTPSVASTTTTAGGDTEGDLSPYAGPVTRNLAKVVGLTRRRSLKRQAPPPPPSSGGAMALARSASSPVVTGSHPASPAPSSSEAPTSSSPPPPAPSRSQSSHEATRKLASTIGGATTPPIPPDLYEQVMPYFSAKPAAGLKAIPTPPLSPVHPGPSPPAPLYSTSGPLVPLAEETEGPNDDDELSDAGYPGEDWSDVPRGCLATNQRLHRSDSIVTVAHLYEDLYVISPFFRVTLTNLTVVVILLALMVPNISTLLYTTFRLVFGTLFPAYYSYKAVKTKNVKEYVKWMMYWIVFAFFTCLETITDLFLAFWFPFYYELKILLVLWLLSPATRGSSILYRKFVHPWLTQREEEIDDCIARAKQQGYSTVLQLGTKGVNYATTVIMQTAIKGGGGLVNQLKRSYSVGELGTDDDHDGGPHSAAGDYNRNIKALPAHDAPDYHHHHSGGQVIGRSSSHSNVSRRTNSSTRSTKTRSVDASELYHSTHDLSGEGDPMTTSMTAPGPTASRRRSPRTHQDRSQHMPLYPDAALPPAPKGPARRRGRSENARPRPKSMINSGEVREAYHHLHQGGRPRLNTHSGGVTKAGVPVIAKPVTRPAASTEAIPLHVNSDTE